MKPYTVNELVACLRKLQTRGCGDHIVLVSDDEECNGYHALWGSLFVEGEPFVYYSDDMKQAESAKTILID